MHTPTPWRVHEWGNTFQIVEDVVRFTQKPGITMAGQQILAREITKGNADFIVKACNNHDRLKELEKHLKALTLATGIFLRSLDEAMKGPSTPERGQKIAKLSNDLEMARDHVRYFALGVDYRHDPELKVKGKRTVVK